MSIRDVGVQIIIVGFERDDKQLAASDCGSETTVRCHWWSPWGGCCVLSSLFCFGFCRFPRHKHTKHSILSHELTASTKPFQFPLFFFASLRHWVVYKTSWRIVQSWRKFNVTWRNPISTQLTHCQSRPSWWRMEISSKRRCRHRFTQTWMPMRRLTEARMEIHRSSIQLHNFNGCRWRIFNFNSFFLVILWIFQQQKKLKHFIFFLQFLKR